MKQYLDMLGLKAKDCVTNFSGVITSVSFDLYGCVQFALTPEADKEGKLSDGRWFDTNRLVTAGTVRVMPAPSFASEPAMHDHGPADKPAPR